MKLVRGLPPLTEHKSVALDLEVFKMQEGRLHRPTGMFACLSIAHPNGNVYQIDDKADIPEALLRVRKCEWVGHNLPFDLFHLSRWYPAGPRLWKHPKVWDTLLAERFLFGGYYENFGLEDLYRRWFGKRMKKEVRDLFSGRETMTEEMRRYAAADAFATLKIRDLQWQFAKENGYTLDSYTDIDLPMIPAILSLQPVRPDVDGWVALAEKHASIAKEIRAAVGFNPGSHEQVKKKLPFLKNTKAETLEANMERSPKLIKEILRYRMYAKAASTYGLKWIERHVEADGLVYPAWRITGAETGRMSCRDPNLQQIPVRRMPEFRKLFSSIHKDGKLLMADVSQQETALTAQYSQDPELCAMIRARKDTHLEVARTVLGLPTLKSTDPRRDSIGKKINLGSVYGLTKYGVAREVGISVRDAEMFINRYFAKFGGVRSWIFDMQKQALSLGYVRTLYERRIFVNTYSRQWEANAANSPIQGSAAEMTKLATWYYFAHHKPYCASIIVHDELVLDIPPGELVTQRKALGDAWDVAAKQFIPQLPVRIDMAVGKTWGDK